MPLVDVAINVRGKPLQTAVTLLSLLDRSGDHIGRIHFTLEREQPYGANLGKLISYLSDRVTVHHPTFFFGVRPQRSRLLMKWGPYRRSFRYQQAWESSSAPFLFITHNDVLFQDDLLGELLARIEGHIAAGPVGQCWNCPASFAGKCAPDLYQAYRPSYAEWQELARQHPGPRAAHYADVVDRHQPWPLPECRLNEWSALIDLRLARPITMPQGKAVPFGALTGLDIGTQWFHDVAQNGMRVKHVDVAPFATHAWASATGGGHAALSDREVYEREEALAREYLIEHYGTSVLARLEG